jgi:hypothetical protein
MTQWTDDQMDLWNDAALAAMRGQPQPASDPHSAEGYAHGLEARKVCLHLLERPEGYYHLPLETEA